MYASSTASRLWVLEAAVLDSYFAEARIRQVPASDTLLSAYICVQLLIFIVHLSNPSQLSWMNMHFSVIRVLRKNTCSPGTASLGHLLLSRCSIVREYSGRRIIYIASFPLFVGHPEVHYHGRLSCIVLLEYIAVQK